MKKPWVNPLPSPSPDWWIIVTEIATDGRIEVSHSDDPKPFASFAMPVYKSLAG